MVGRILRTADFERALAQAPRSRSTHFAAHHVAARPLVPTRGSDRAGCTDLSTGSAPSCPPPVDESPNGWWLGTVVPKRHAKRSVTRNLIKRQMREVMKSVAADLPHGLWVLRLKSVFDRKQFASPASVPLRLAAREEITLLLQRAIAPASFGGGESRRKPRRADPVPPATA